MKKFLLGASALAVIALVSGAASATELKAQAGVALSETTGAVDGNFEFVFGATADKNTMGKGAFEGAAGIVHAAQNAGANSGVQTGTTVGAVIGCDCGNDKYRTSVSLAAAASDLDGSVSANAVDIGETLTSNTISDHSFADFAGVAQVSQNTGANSLMQSQSTVGVILY